MKNYNSNPPENVKKCIINCIADIQKSHASIENEFDALPLDIRSPFFYILPKIHKETNENLPLKYPGRPIVSACNSPTENIWKYIDSNHTCLNCRLSSKIQRTS